MVDFDFMSKMLHEGQIRQVIDINPTIEVRNYESTFISRDVPMATRMCLDRRWISMSFRAYIQV